MHAKYTRITSDVSCASMLARVIVSVAVVSPSPRPCVPVLCAGAGSANFKQLLAFVSADDGSTAAMHGEPRSISAQAGTAWAEEMAAAEAELARAAEEEAAQAAAQAGAEAALAAAQAAELAAVELARTGSEPPGEAAGAAPSGVRQTAETEAAKEAALAEEEVRAALDAARARAMN